MDVRGQGRRNAESYWLAQTRLAHQREWLHAEFYGRARDMKRLDFFGLGAGTTQEADRTTYRFIDRSAVPRVGAVPGFRRSLARRSP